MKTEARIVPRQAEGLELTKAMNLERWDFRTKSTFHRIVKVEKDCKVDLVELYLPSERPVKCQ